MHTSIHLLTTAFIIASPFCWATKHNERPDDLTITLNPSWQKLGHGKAAKSGFGGSWIHAGTMVIKKKLNENIYLARASFNWRGKTLPVLHASLYRKNGEPFLPIDNNLVSDGTWKAHQQLLTFTFDERQLLDPVTTFYLVLTVPPHLEQRIKEGRFDLAIESLPDQMQPYIHTKNISLSFSTLPQQRRTKIALAKSFAR
jgi:hypothetical protein